MTPAEFQAELDEWAELEGWMAMTFPFDSIKYFPLDRFPYWGA